MRRAKNRIKPSTNGEHTTPPAATTSGKTITVPVNADVLAMLEEVQANYRSDLRHILKDYSDDLSGLAENHNLLRLMLSAELWLDQLVGQVEAALESE